MTVLFIFSLFELILITIILALIVLIGWLLTGFQRKRDKSYQALSSWMLDLLEAMPDMAVIFDSDERILDVVNPKQMLLQGVSPKELIGRTLLELSAWAPEIKDMATTHSAKIKELQETRKPTEFTYELKVGDKVFYGRTRLVPFGKSDILGFSHDITNQISAEKEITRLKTFFQSIVDNLPVGVTVKNASENFHYCFINNRILEIYEDRKMQLGLDDFELNYPEAATFHEEDISVRDTRIPITRERVFYNKETGKPFKWAETSKTHFTDNEGNVYILVTVADTTEIKKKQFELEAFRLDLTLALESGNLMAGTYDVREKRFKSLYRQIMAKDGTTIDDVLEHTHPEDKHLYTGLFERLISGQLKKDKVRIRFVINGENLWYEVYVMAIQDETGAVTHLIGTERNVNEEVVKQLELLEVKSKMELAFQSAGIAPWEFNPELGIFSSLYPEVYESIGLTISEYASFIEPEDEQLFINAMENIVSGKQNEMSIQVRVTFPNQPQQRWFQLQAVVFQRDQQGKPLRIIGLRRDITDVKMTDELIELRNKAEESNRLKSAFLANMSHEIRTPLNAIVGFSNLIMEYTEVNEELQEYFNIIERNNELLLQLINDILDLSKIEAGQLDFNYSDFELDSLFDNLKHTYASRLQSGVELIYQQPENLCIIHSEKNRLTQVVSNFLSNACKFTSAGSITMGFMYTDDGIRFFVRDTGKGISEKHVDKVFNRFSKFDHFVQGTGLGLSICETIVHFLGGEIGVNSKLGEGSEFWFTIPCKPILSTL